MWDKVSKDLDEREKLIKKLKNADTEYQNILNKAKEDADAIVSQAKKHSEIILSEGEMLAKDRSRIILEEWEYKAKSILLQAEKDVKKMEDHLVNNWVDSLKKTSKLLVKKILKSDEQLQEKYLDNLIHDLETNW